MPTPSNSLNITSPGLVSFDGSHAFVANITTHHGVIVGGILDTISSTAVGLTGQVLQGNTAADPTYSTATYPSTTTVNQILYSSSTNIVGGITAVIDGVLISDHGAGIPSFLANGTAGYVLTAQSGAPPAWAAGGGGSSPATGSLQYFATSGGSSLTGYLPCDGAIVSQATYPALYSQIGLLNAPDTVWSVTATLQTLASTSSLQTIAYDESKYLIGTNAAYIFTSTDTITWTKRFFATANVTTVANLAYGASTYVTWTGTTVFSSTDCLNWGTPVLNNPGGTFGYLTYGNSLFVLGTNLGLFSRSTNAVTWTSTRAPCQKGPVSLTYGNGLFVSCGQLSISTSTDAITWESSSPSSGISAGIGPGMIYAGSLLVTAGTSGVISTSTNATSWIGKTSNTTSNINALTYGLSTYVYAGAGGVLYSSTDATTWTVRTSGTTSVINALTFGTLFVYAGAGGVLRSSTDAITWDSRISGTSSIISALTFGTVYVYGGAGGVLYSSTDATTWTVRTSGTTSAINALTFGTVYVYAAGNVIRSSTDAITWNARTPPFLDTWICLLYANSLYVCGSNLGNIITSTDATTWTATTSVTTNAIFTLAYNGSVYIAGCGAQESVLTSTDAVTWTKNFSPATATINIVKAGSSSFVYAGNQGGIGTSTNGVTWTISNSKTNTNINNLAYGNGKFYYTGTNSSISNCAGSSTDGITWSVQNTGSAGISGVLQGLIYGDRFIGICASISGNINTGYVVKANNTYSYDTTTSFALPLDNSLAITTQTPVNFPRSLYIKT